MGPTVNDIKAEAMLEMLTEWGWLEKVEIDYEAAEGALAENRRPVAGRWVSSIMEDRQEATRSAAVAVIYAALGFVGGDDE
jgi:hypothetical protein